MVASMTDVTSDTAPFSAVAAEAILVAACELRGLESSDARLLRLGENALFHLPAQTVVVPIARTMDYWRDAVKEVSVSRWLASSEFPAARVHQVAQPIEVSGHPVTFWRFINGRNGGRTDIARLGALLHRLHEMPRPTEFDLPDEDILGRVRKRIDPLRFPRPTRTFCFAAFTSLPPRCRVSSIRLLLPQHMATHMCRT